MHLQKGLNAWGGGISLWHFPRCGDSKHFGSLYSTSRFWRHFFRWCLPESRAVVGQDDQLSFALSDHLLGLLVAQHVLATLHHQLESGVDGLHRLFLHSESTLPRVSANVARLVLATVLALASVGI